MKFRLLLLIALTMQITMASAQGLTTLNQGFKNPGLRGNEIEKKLAEIFEE